MRNRNATYESLRAAVNLLYCDNEDEFNRLYCLATHSKGGRHVWWCMFNKDVKAKELYYKKKSLMDSFEKSERARASQPNSKPIRCLELNLVFSSTHEAANYFDIEISCIRYAIKNNKRCRGFHFEYFTGF